MTSQSDVLSADKIHMAVNEKLAGAELPSTPRRPDVRLIVLNTGSEDVHFRNPGGHADKDETIPAGQAAMAMLAGDTLQEQQANAQNLVGAHGLSENGLGALAAALKAGSLPSIKEVYGPAPFEKQAGQLVPVRWTEADGSSVEISPVQNGAIAFGTRAATKETVFRVTLPADSAYGHIQGTNTNAERLITVEDGKTMFIGVSPVLDNSWQPTGEYTTKPIALSAAKEFYGKDFSNIPSVNLDKDGNVLSVNLNPSAAPYVKAEGVDFVRYSADFDRAAAAGNVAEAAEILLSAGRSFEAVSGAPSAQALNTAIAWLEYHDVSIERDKPNGIAAIAQAEASLDL